MHDARRILGGVVLLLRDLCEGDISFGWGDMKFFGQCLARIESVAIHAACHQQAWLQLLDDLHAPTLSGVDPRAIDRELTDQVNAVRRLVAENQIDNQRVLSADRVIDELLSAVRQEIAERFGDARAEESRFRDSQPDDTVSFRRGHGHWAARQPQTAAAVVSHVFQNRQTRRFSRDLFEGMGG